jgi:hypothetical protein
MNLFGEKLYMVIVESFLLDGSPSASPTIKLM